LFSSFIILSKKIICWFTVSVTKELKPKIGIYGWGFWKGGKEDGHNGGQSQPTGAAAEENNRFYHAQSVSLFSTCLQLRFWPILLCL